MTRPHHHRDAPAQICRVWLHVACTSAWLLFGGCRTQHAIDIAPTHHTVEIEPIYMTVDINIRVQRELDTFYEDVVAGARTRNEQGGEL